MHNLLDAAEHCGSQKCDPCARDLGVCDLRSILGESGDLVSMVISTLSGVIIKHKYSYHNL